MANFMGSQGPELAAIYLAQQEERGLTHCVAVMGLGNIQRAIDLLLIPSLIKTIFIIYGVPFLIIFILGEESAKFFQLIHFFSTVV